MEKKILQLREELERALERSEKATPGTWVVKNETLCSFIYNGDNDFCRIIIRGERDSIVQTQHDTAAFIARARVDVPYLAGLCSDMLDILEQHGLLEELCEE